MLEERSYLMLLDKRGRGKSYLYLNYTSGLPRNVGIFTGTSTGWLIAVASKYATNTV